VSRLFNLQNKKGPNRVEKQQVLCQASENLPRPDCTREPCCQPRSLQGRLGAGKVKEVLHTQILTLSLLLLWEQYKQLEGSIEFKEDVKGSERTSITKCDDPVSARRSACGAKRFWRATLGVLLS
jgi:hypothetical protein